MTSYEKELLSYLKVNCSDIENNPSEQIKETYRALRKKGIEMFDAVDYLEKLVKITQAYENKISVLEQITQEIPALNLDDFIRDEKDAQNTLEKVRFTGLTGRLYKNLERVKKGRFWKENF